MVSIVNLKVANLSIKMALSKNCCKFAYVVLKCPPQTSQSCFALWISSMWLKRWRDVHAPCLCPPILALWQMGHLYLTLFLPPFIRWHFSSAVGTLQGYDGPRRSPMWVRAWSAEIASWHVKHLFLKELPMSFSLAAMIFWVFDGIKDKQVTY